MKKSFLSVVIILLICNVSYSKTKSIKEDLKEIKEKQQTLDDRLYELEYESASKEEKAEMDRIERERLDMLNKEIERMKKLGYTLDEEEVLKDDEGGKITRVRPTSAPTRSDREIDIFEAQTKAKKK